MGLLSFAAAGADKLRILVDSEHRERLEAEDAKCTMFDSEEQAWHVDTASVQRGGRWRKGQGTRPQKLQPRQTATRYVCVKTCKLMGGSLLAL